MEQNEEYGIKINGQFVSNIRYADDTAILASSEEMLQQMVNDVNEVCKVYGMSLNAKKTKVMAISRNRVNRVKIKINGCQLEQVKQYQYLGSLITEDGRCLEEIRRRINIAKSAFWDNKEVMRRNVDIKLKLRLLKCYVFSIVSYGSETLSYMKEMQKRLNAFEMWCYRRILKISWADRVSNEEIRKRLGIKKTLSLDLARKKMAFAGHVCRGSSGDFLQLLTEGKIEGNRGRGRIRRQWGTDVKEWADCNNWAQVKRKAENRQS